MIFDIPKYENADEQDSLRPFLLFGHSPLTSYFKLSYLFVRASTNGVLTEGTFHNPGPGIPPRDQLPRRFSAGNEKACEEIQAHLLGVKNAFKRMKQLSVSSDEADSYFLDMLIGLPGPAESSDELVFPMIKPADSTQSARSSWFKGMIVPNLTHPRRSGKPTTR